MTDNELYKRYGIDNTKKAVDKERLEKTMDDIAYCRAHLEKINETREALFKVLDELPKMHEHIIQMEKYLMGLSTHVMRLEQLLGIEDYGLPVENDGLGG